MQLMALVRFSHFRLLNLFTENLYYLESLSRQQLDLGFTELSAACRLAAAQLEQSIAGFNAGSSSARSGLEYNNLYVESARTFFLSNEQASTYECYEGAISSTNDASLAWLTSMEAGQTALHLNEYLNAISFFTKAYQLAENYTEKNISGI
jgi:tetratricopeptide (TPR) repeat protein